MVRCLYDEAIDLTSLGRSAIQRASYVEPDQPGQRWADLSPVRGPRLNPFLMRSEALLDETAWIEKNWLMTSGSKEPESS